MDTSARPIALHVGLQYICRVHGLTPHSSTGRCPFELVREGPTASLFPQLTKSTQKAAELTAVRQSINRSGKRVTFTEGECVSVYDFKSKLSALGVIKQVLGTNTYSVDCGKGFLQHVSGDALSKTSLDAQEVGRPELTAQQEDLGQGESDVVIESDSDSSDDEEDYGHNIVPALLPRRRRGRLVANQGLGPLQPTRLRPRLP